MQFTWTLAAFLHDSAWLQFDAWISSTLSTEASSLQFGCKEATVFAAMAAL